MLLLSFRTQIVLDNFRMTLFPECVPVTVIIIKLISVNLSVAGSVNLRIAVRTPLTSDDGSHEICDSILSGLKDKAVFVIIPFAGGSPFQLAFDIFVNP